MPVRILVKFAELLNGFQFSPKNNNGTVLESVAVVSQNNYPQGGI